VRLHSGDRAHTVRTTLAALEARLDPGQFRRISRSTLVNLDRVREVQPWFHGDAVVILESGASSCGWWSALGFTSGGTAGSTACCSGRQIGKAGRVLSGPVRLPECSGVRRI
jgi:hypothetical protein